MIQLKKGIVCFLIIFGLISILYSVDYISIYSKEIARNQFSFYADNTNYCPYQLEISSITFGNSQVEADFPINVVIKPQERGKYLFSAWIFDNFMPKFDYQYKTSMGDPNINIDTNSYFPYLFPFENGTEHRVTQGYNTRYSHHGVTKYSIDIGLDMKTKIYAARDGIVVGVKTDSKWGGLRSWYRDLANYITIYQNDGTFAQYVHLTQNGNLVKVGEKVKAGDLIGLSGNTGWTRGPHLHFMVWKPKSFGRESIPTKFLNMDNTLVSLRARRFYKAFHPDNDNFTNKYFMSQNDSKNNNDKSDNNQLIETNLGSP